MAYDPALLLRKSWASPDELAQELYVLLTAAQREAPKPEPPPRLRVVTRPPGGVQATQAPTPYTLVRGQPAGVPPPEFDLPKIRQFLEASRSTVLHDPDLPHPPTEPPPGKPLLMTQAPETPPKVRESPSGVQSTLARRGPPASGAAPFAGSEAPEFLTASITTSAFDPVLPVARELPAISEVSSTPGLRSVPPATPEPATGIVQSSPVLRADSQLAVVRPAAAIAALPTGTPELVEVAHPLAEFPLEQLRTEIARRDLAAQADNVKPAPILDPPFAFVIMGLVQIDDDGVTALKTPATGGEGMGTPGKGKAYLLDHNGNNLELNSNDKLDVWNLGDVIAPNTYTEAFLIQEEFWWVIGRSPGGAFFADHLNIAAATGLLTGPPTLHNTTGNVYRINNGAMELYKSSATIYNGMTDPTDSTMRQILNENIDGTFTVINESCTAP